MTESNWIPKTELGRKVQNKEITDIDEILLNGQTILEEEIVDELLDLETDLLLIGQSKGKFGGGKRRVFRQTQKKTREGNKPRFTTMAIVGDKNGHIGIGYGKSKETVLARNKATRKAKLNIFMIRRGSGSWESKSPDPHSIPYAVEGKCSSVIIKLKPAPKGTGLCIEKECAKILELAGIKDVWSKSYGQTKNKINMIKALDMALRQLVSTRVQQKHKDLLNLLDGSEKIQKEESKSETQRDTDSKVKEQSANELKENKSNDQSNDKKSDKKVQKESNESEKDSKNSTKTKTKIKTQKRNDKK